MAELLRRTLNTRDAAAYVGGSVSLLRKMRMRGPDDRDPGPAYIKLSATLVVYEITELDRWLDSHRDITGIQRQTPNQGHAPVAVGSFDQCNAALYQSRPGYYPCVEEAPHKSEPAPRMLPRKRRGM